MLTEAPEVIQPETRPHTGVLIQQTALDTPEPDWQLWQAFEDRFAYALLEMTGDGRAYQVEVQRAEVKTFDGALSGYHLGPQHYLMANAVVTLQEWMFCEVGEHVREEALDSEADCVYIRTVSNERRFDRKTFARYAGGPRLRLWERVS